MKTNNRTIGVWGDEYQKSLHYCPDNRLHRFTGLHAIGENRKTWMKSCRRCVQSIITQWDEKNGQIREFVTSGYDKTSTPDTNDDQKQTTL